MGYDMYPPWASVPREKNEIEGLLWTKLLKSSWIILA